jgi:thiol-disulfide isomerase/thioredoxin
MKEIKSFEEFDNLLNECNKMNKYLLVDFHAPYCSPCNKLGKYLGEIEKDYKNVIMIKIDISQDEGDINEIVDEYEIPSIPTILILDGSNNIVEKILKCNEEKLNIGLKKI